ncbi:MAG: tyrosine-type recombinase/integrase [Desulfarculaceae bacterium]|nr:tyrosine-type recombinase/integrase [Desulfarculaceae bacterium]MCF8073255.1 tyrosine-type recombinase/integrase [Desulfarculaceae bacterium]MCF8100851.1 tyrosine-type recombinase/integrase [Desulfarculaceae bacterium]
MGIPLYIQEHLRAAAMQRGRLQSTQVCPKCKQRGRYALKTYDGVTVLECACGQFAATKGFRVRIGHRGRDLHIYHTQAGKRFASLEESQAALETIRGEIKRGVFDPDLWKPTSPLVWENYLAEYLAREASRVEVGEISPATLRKKKFWAKHLAGLNGNNLRELQDAQIRDFAAGLAYLAPKTRADVLQELRHILAEAVYWKDIPRAPRVPGVKIDRKAPPWITQEKQEAILAKVPREHRPILRFAMQYGCRVSEACNLTWGQVYLAEGVLVLSGTKQRRDNPLPIVHWFETWAHMQPKAMPHVPVFTNPQARNEAGGYTPDFLRGIWNTAAEAAGYRIKLKNATRHSLGNRLRRDGWDEGAIARMLGHSSTQHTRQFYVDTDVELLREKLLRTHRVHTAKNSDTTS